MTSSKYQITREGFTYIISDGRQRGRLRNTVMELLSGTIRSIDRWKLFKWVEKLNQGMSVEAEAFSSRIEAMVRENPLAAAQAILNAVNSLLACQLVTPQEIQFVNQVLGNPATRAAILAEIAAQERESEGKEGQ